jgi:hypothetical protein
MRYPLKILKMRAQSAAEGSAGLCRLSRTAGDGLKYCRLWPQFLSRMPTASRQIAKSFSSIFRHGPAMVRCRVEREPVAQQETSRHALKPAKPGRGAGITGRQEISQQSFKNRQGKIEWK